MVITAGKCDITTVFSSVRLPLDLPSNWHIPAVVTAMIFDRVKVIPILYFLCQNTALPVINVTSSDVFSCRGRLLSFLYAEFTR